MTETYKAGGRRWWKVKKDYLGDGAMADSADLVSHNVSLVRKKHRVFCVFLAAPHMACCLPQVVLGAYFGTGTKGGMMSVFLMGVWDESTGCWKTVCKCGNGHDDAKLAELQHELKDNMVKIGRKYDDVPAWLDVTRGLVPDFVVVSASNLHHNEITGEVFDSRM